jgi:hypothetical protein
LQRVLAFLGACLVPLQGRREVLGAGGRGSPGKSFVAVARET